MSTVSRTKLIVGLAPVVGERFQPTGFPDLGAATFERAGVDGEQLLVESVQSMANHLEGTTWDTATNEPPAAVSALPYVRVVDVDGEFLTSSRLEAHRLASAYMLEATVDGSDVLSSWAERFGLVRGKPLDGRRVAREVFALDPVSLLHGVFFAKSAWPWQPKIARAVTAFVEASDVRAAVSGGVKKDSVHNEADKAAGMSSVEGYGMVPYHRVEYTAREIRLSAVVDEQQLRSYGLSEAATEVLSALAWWELASLLAGGLRLRTACDLEVTDVLVGELPDFDAAGSRLAAAVAAARDELAAPSDVVWAPPKGARSKAAAGIS